MLHLENISKHHIGLNRASRSSQSEQQQGTSNECQFDHIQFTLLVNVTLLQRPRGGNDPRTKPFQQGFHLSEDGGLSSSTHSTMKCSAAGVLPVGGPGMSSGWYVLLEHFITLKAKLQSKDPATLVWIFRALSSV